MQEQFIALFNHINHLLWSYLLIALLIAVGIFYTFRLRFIQISYLPQSLIMACSSKEGKADGDISPFQSLMTSLAASIGISNIAGVATAVMAGGMGAVFWMWIIAWIGMPTKYAEAVLAIKFRRQDAQGAMQGGPMVYIERGLGWKKLAMGFAFFGCLAAMAGGNLTQSHAITHALGGLMTVNHHLIGGVMALMTLMILWKGIRSIGIVSAYLVPLMALLYVGFGLVVIFSRLELIPGVLKLILTSAFEGQAAMGGFVGATVAHALQFGVSRGISSSEAGLGSAPIATAAAKTDYAARQGLIAMSGTFFSSMIICTITALTIGVSQLMGSCNQQGEVLNGVILVMQAFKQAIPRGELIVAIGVVLFGYSTIVGWAYYGEQCFRYLFQQAPVRYFRWLFCLVVYLGAIASLELVWPIVDVMNGMMALPNIIALFFLSNEVIEESEIFFKVLKAERLGVKKTA